MQNPWRPLLLLSVVLFAPMVPFLLLGDRLEPLVTKWFERQTGALATSMLVVGLLATDIVLPIPSSLISTMGGARLGWLMGTVAAWLGMTLGATFGFAISRRWGRPVARWFARGSDLELMHAASERWGTVVLIAARAVPVVAEASVLLFGLNRLSWRQFFPPVLLSNLGIALAYSAFGDWAQQYEWLPIALGVSVALPVLLASGVRPLLRRRW